MEITHDAARCLFQTEVNGTRAYVSYVINNGCLDIEHTIVPPEIGGRGIAAALVKAAYDYALSQNLSPRASCEYAAAWLKRNPSYSRD